MADETTKASEPAPVERKFVKDKAYLQDSNGVIWEYEALLSKRPDFTRVIPNPTKQAKEAEPKK